MQHGTERKAESGLAGPGTKGHRLHLRIYRGGLPGHTGTGTWLCFRGSLLQMAHVDISPVSVGFPFSPTPTLLSAKLSSAYPPISFFSITCPLLPSTPQHLPPSPCTPARVLPATFRGNQTSTSRQLLPLKKRQSINQKQSPFIEGSSCAVPGTT